MRRTLGILLAVLAAFALSTTVRAESSKGAAARAAIDAVVARLAGNGTTAPRRNAVVHVSAPKLGFEHSAAAGIARADSMAPMTAAHPFYIASITKPMVATRIMQLVEADRLSLDTTLGDTGVLPPDALERLQVYGGHSYGAEITIRQLLQHRTGLRDMLLDDRQHLSEDVESGVAPASLGGIWTSQLARYMACRAQSGTCSDAEAARLYPGHRWTAWNAAAWQRDATDRDAGLMNFFLAEMDKAGLFPPGRSFHYADTNYILLGMLIERISGRNLHAELRDAIFAPLRMRDTYLSYAPDPEAKPRDLQPADFWIGEVPVVSSGVDISFDWAGGGIVTTVADLNRFLRGLQQGTVFRHAATRDAMLQCLDTPARNGRGAGGYGLGIRCIDTDYGPMWGHTGAWGSVMVLFPQQDISITGTVDRLFDDQAMQSLVFGSMAAMRSAGLVKEPLQPARAPDR
jgi:D-alanyl-D-alanine carboxypeptidase